MRFETERPQTTSFPRSRFVCACGHVGRWTSDFDMVRVSEQVDLHLADPAYADRHAQQVGPVEV